MLEIKMAETQKNKFKLGRDLEQLVNVANSAHSVRNASLFRVNEDLRNQATGFYGSLSQSGISSIDPRTLKAVNEDDFRHMLSIGEGQVYNFLESKIDNDTHKQAREFYLGNLDENHRLLFYANMLDEVGMPKKPGDDAKEAEKEIYKALSTAKKELELARAVEESLRKGDMATAKELIEQHTGAEDIELLAVYGRYAAPVFRDAERKVYADVAAKRRETAMSLIKEKDLYSAIDQIVSENKQGKARSLTGMYNVYNSQLKYNEAKEKAEKEAENKKNGNEK